MNAPRYVTFAIATMKFWVPVCIRAWSAGHWEPAIMEDLTGAQKLWFDSGGSAASACSALHNVLLCKLVDPYF